MILLIDNYDSFTYNLVQRIGELRLGREMRVMRNDAATIEEFDALSPRHIIISPGPGRPDDAGLSMRIIEHFCEKTPILGVCLGHQCIGQVFGAKIIRAARLMHGKVSPISHDGNTIYRDMTNPFSATRYHSLIIDDATLGDDFERTAWSDRKELMGIRHKKFPLEGVQFHPESFLTDQGKRLLANFLGA